jgi:hypothetical protein
MSELNHYWISSILHSKVGGKFQFGHGQIDSLGDAQRYFDALATHKSEAGEEPPADKIEVDALKEAFFAARAAFGDRGSTDLYVAHPERNKVFLQQCRKLGIRASEYAVNKKLLNARKAKLLPDLDSQQTSVNYGKFAFASEFAATKLRYRTGASIDDILCDPELSSEFDAIARKITPGRSVFEYRWAILSIRKAGRSTKLPRTFKMPTFKSGFRLAHDRIERVPEQQGVYLLYERQKLLYTRSTDDLREGIELHRQPSVLEALAEKLWTPNPDELTVDYAAVPQKMGYLRAIERRLVLERHPVFNIPRSAGLAA